ncbi:MAG TPA: HAMP domain-containing sensor histidine kinase [Candidatus Dormibacteraeota bacterium]|nr:HAMP domain-containing sensor histidine kinase [Candidatus Dormibacteraeota bacterium]
MSLRLRLALFGTGVVALALVLFGVLLYSLLALGANNNQDTQLRARARQAAAATAVADLSPHPLIAAADLRNSTEMYVEVLDPYGSPLYATAMLDGAPPPVPDGLLAQATAHNGAFATEGDAKKSTQLRVYAQPFVGGYVIAGQSTRVPASSLNGVIVFLIISGLATLIAALIASWLVAGRALRPLRLVARTADDIGSTKDFSRRLAVGRRGDEVALLSGSFNRMLAALEDAYRALAGALEAQQRFVADASHELRTPLATIQGNAGLLAIGPNVDEKVRRAAAADIVGESERMARLTDRLLTLARADSGLDLQLAPVQLAPLAAEVARQAASLHPDLTLSTDLDDLAVAGDQDALRQLLWILLDNAARHARSRISVGVRAEEGWARLMVADDGRGVPPEERERIFERFYKADPSRRDGGAGLGLAIARWITGQHHGRIIAAEGPEGGAAFFVDLPLLSRS